MTKHTGNYCLLMTDMAILLMPCVKAPPEQFHLHLSARADTISARGSVSDTGTKGRRRAEGAFGCSRTGRWFNSSLPPVSCSSKLQTNSC